MYDKVLKLITKGWITVPDIKKKRKRVTPVPEGVLSLIRMYVKEKALRPWDRLFPYSNVTLNNWLHKAVEGTNIQAEEEEGRIRWHSIRGSFIRWHQDKPVKAMEQVTGDRYSTLMEYYTEYRPDDLKKLFDEKGY